MADFNPTIGTGSTVVLEDNSKRQRVIFCNYSDELMYLSQSGLARITFGIPIAPNGGSYEDQPDPTGYMWMGSYHAICASGGKILSVTEQNRVA